MTDPLSSAAPAQQNSTAIEQVLAFARAQIGKPYVFGATGPNSYDCSGLAQAAYASAGIRISRVTETQIAEGSPVSQSQLAPGDLVFPDPGHVQIYSGNGNVIEAPHSGANVREVPMWGFWQARRITSGGTNVAASLLSGLGNLNPLAPLDTAKSLFELFTWPEKVASHLASPKFDRRIALGFLGALIIVAGIFVALNGSGLLAKEVQKAKKTAEIVGVFAK